MADNALTQLQTPVQALGTVLPVVQAINQNKLFQGKIAVGNALQQATDPNTGQLDPLQFNKLVAADPNAAAAMQDAADQSQRLQNQQQALSGNQLGLVSSTLGSVLALPDDQLHAGTNAGLGKLVTAGVLPGWKAAALAQQLPQDPNALRSSLNQLQLSIQPPTAQTDQIFGTPDQQSNGQSLIAGVRAPARAGGGFNGSTVTQQYPSRSELLAMQPGQDAQGRPVVTPQGVRANQAGAGALTGPAGAQLPGRGLPANSPLVPPGYTGRYVQSADGSVPVGPAPGTADAAALTAKAGAEQGVELQKTADQSPSRLSVLNNMASDLNGFTPGPGNDRETYAQSLIQRYAPAVAESFGLKPDRVASAESFDKFASGLAMQQAGMIGAGTDAKLTAAMHANPNSGMSKMTVQQMIPVLQGNEDAIQAKNKAWQGYQQQHGPGSYGTFSMQFNQMIDPRAFQAMRMAPEDRAKMVAAMAPQDRAAFRQKFNAAVQSGLIALPNAGSAPGG